MNRKRIQPIAPAILVGLALATSAGPVPDVAATPVAPGPGARGLHVLPKADRKAAAQLLACLTDAAKALHGFDGKTHSAAAIVNATTCSARSLFVVRIESRPVEDFDFPTAPPLQDSLIDLPPPVC